MLYFAALALGAIVGSFLNALSFRLGTGKSVLRGRSRCMRCNATLRARDLVPLFSYAFVRGRCRYCASRISAQYPLVEAAGAALSLLVFLEHPAPPAFIFWLAVWMTLLFIVVYDIRHKIIPASASLSLGALALVFALSAETLFSGPMLAAPLFLISFFSRGRAMGWGDGALELSLGWLLGLSAGLTALMLAFWSGALVGIAFLLSSKVPASPKASSLAECRRASRVGYTMKSEVPLAPFLILGAAVAHFLHVDFFPSLPLLLQ